MRTEYASARDVQQLRWLVWVVGGGLLLVVLWLLTVKVLRVSEARAVSATRENLAASLSALAAQQMAQGKALDERWLQRNPFALLRWPSSDYCGELTAAEMPQPGCWHYLPLQGWLLHRSRFTDTEQGLVGQLQVFQLQAVSARSLSGSQLPRRIISMELVSVPAAEVAALADTYQ